MIIIGADYHPSFQQIAWVDTSSGESGEQRLQHNEEAEKFYRDLKERGVKVRIGMEAGGHARWLERLLAELQFELCVFLQCIVQVTKFVVAFIVEVVAVPHGLCPFSRNGWIPYAYAYGPSLISGSSLRLTLWRQPLPCLVSLIENFESNRVPPRV
jgi:hypothetical protein